MARKKQPAAAKSRFKVYRPTPKAATPNKSDDRPTGKRFQVFKPAKPTREPDPPPESRVSRFKVYKPPPEPVRLNKPNGSSWLEVDGYWVCEYGCKTFKVKEAPNGVADSDYHVWNCRYWWEAGIDETPF